MIKVMIDPGHGPGNVNKGPTGYYEHEGNWKISNFLKDILESVGNQADLTRTIGENPNLYTRGKKAQGYDLFISEHSNASNGEARGVEAYYDFSKPYDEELAKKIIESVASVMGNNSRRANTRVYTQDDGKTYNYYGVIRSASATNCKHIVLVENGFHDNIEDEAFLKEDENLRKIAQAQANAIYEFFNENEIVHWAEKYKKSLEAKGIPIYDTRYDEPMTRGEVFALLDRIIE